MGTYDDDDKSSDDPSEVANRLLHSLVNVIEEKVQEKTRTAVAIPGTLCRVVAFKRMLFSLKLLQSNLHAKFNLTVGFVVVMSLKIIGPPAVLFYGFYALDWSAVRFGTGRWTYKLCSNEHGVSNLTKQLLGAMFIFLFILNAIYEADRDRNEMKKLEFLWRVFTMSNVRKHFRDQGRPLYTSQRAVLYLDALINAWVLILASSALLPLFILADSPLEVILDSFGLAFLYTLDDAHGPLGFLDDQWPDQVFGDLFMSCNNCLTDEDVSDEDEHLPEAFRCVSPEHIIAVTEMILWVQLFVVTFLWVFLEGLEPVQELEEKSVEAAIVAMTSNFAQLNMTVPPLYTRNSDCSGWI